LGGRGMEPVSKSVSKSIQAAGIGRGSRYGVAVDLEVEAHADTPLEP